MGSPAGKISMASAISRAIIYNRVLVNTRTLASAANRPPFLRQLPMHKRTVNVAPPFLARRLFRWQLAGVAVTSIRSFDRILLEFSAGSVKESYLAFRSRVVS